MRPIPKGYMGDIDQFEKEEAEERERKRTGKRGRPRKNPEAKVDENKPKRPRGRPRKNPIVQEDKPKRSRGRPRKGENMDKQVKKTAVKGKGKRGRKPSVGAKVLDFINESKGNVKFNDILSVYSDERERLGKRGSAEIEKRNCLSTLYIMKRDGKIREVTPKTVYSAI
jgi:hypothetical protein